MESIVVLGLLLFGLALPAIAADKPEGTCAPEGKMKFVCGIVAPEDLLPLPGGKWIVTSGLALKSGLHLVNLKTKEVERWLPEPGGTAAQPYQACPSPPAPDEIQAHGISLRDRGQGHATLYVVNHGGPTQTTLSSPYPTREAIEVFDVDVNGAKPKLTWIGCVRLPIGLSANSVTSTADGAILLTVVLHPGMTPADYIADRPTGAVYQWRPGEAGFLRVWGTEFTGDNGIEASADGKTIYVVAKDGLRVVTNTNPVTEIKRVPFDGIGDNVHWSDGKLIVAGVKHQSDPACADLFKAAAGELGEKCRPAHFAAAVDPTTLSVTPLLAAPGTKMFSGVTGGIVIGKTLWLGSVVSGKIAYTALP